MFVQIIEGRTSDAEGLTRQGERWQDEVGPGAIGYLGVTAGVTADGHAITIVRFADEKSARANSERPEQGAWWSEMAKYYDGDPSFTESTDVQEFLGGGSNDAGFVQIMKSSGVDRDRVAALDAQFEKLAGMRPDFRAHSGCGPDRTHASRPTTSPARPRLALVSPRRCRPRCRR